MRIFVLPGACWGASYHLREGDEGRLKEEEEERNSGESPVLLAALRSQTSESPQSVFHALRRCIHQIRSLRALVFSLT